MSRPIVIFATISVAAIGIFAIVFSDSSENRNPAPAPIINAYARKTGMTQRRSKGDSSASIKRQPEPELPAREEDSEDKQEPAAVQEGSAQDSCQAVIQRFREWQHQRTYRPDQPAMSVDDQQALKRCIEAEQRPPSTVVKVSASRLAMDYANGPLGPAPYFSRWIEVVGGTVTGVIPWVEGRDEITPQCALDMLLDSSIHACVVKSQAQGAQRLQIGEAVTVVCIANGSGPSGEVFLENCHLR